MSNENTVRFYGSCDHIDNIDSNDLFNKFAVPRMLVPLGGRENQIFYNEVTIENDRMVVHVHPDRYFTCKNCMMEVILDDWRDELRSKSIDELNQVLTEYQPREDNKAL